MFCPECGSEILDDSYFCTECGTSLSEMEEFDEEEYVEAVEMEETPVVPQDLVESEDTTETKKMPSKKKRTTVFIVFGIIAILILLAVALILLKKLGISDKDTKKDVDNQVTEEFIENTESESNELSEIIINTERPAEDVEDIIVEDVQKPDTEDISEPVEDIPDDNVEDDYGQQDSYPVQDGFYGVWCASSKDESEMWVYAEELRARGFDATVVSTNDWSNLNDGWYSVTAGLYSFEEEAESALEEVKNICSDAYVKYSGERY